MPEKTIRSFVSRKRENFTDEKKVFSPRELRGLRLLDPEGTLVLRDVKCLGVVTGARSSHVSHNFQVNFVEVVSVIVRRSWNVQLEHLHALCEAFLPRNHIDYLRDQRLSIFEKFTKIPSKLLIIGFSVIAIEIVVEVVTRASFIEIFFVGVFTLE